MSKLHLTLACGPYDRTQPLRDGSIVPEGIELTYIARQPAEIFWRMLQYQEFDVSEMSLSNYATLVSQGDAPFVGLPVYPSRGFRHGYIFVHADSGIREAKDLAGKRGGVPEYSQTAAVYIRGMLEHDYGVRPTSIEWVQGRADRLEHPLPADLKIHHAPAGRELNDMLDQREIDFLITANNPLSFRRGLPHIRRLFPNYMELEKDYYRRTQIYPIMHLIVMRRAVYEANPWIALSLYQAFAAAKERTYRVLEETGSLKATLAWLQPAIEEEKAVLGEDWWAYGLEASRPSLEALLQYAREQGLLHRPVPAEELFAPSTLRDIPLGEGQFI